MLDLPSTHSRRYGHHVGLAEQATRILSEPVTAGVLVEPRGTQGAVVGGAGGGRASRGVGGGQMFLAATGTELVLLAVGRGLLARRLSGMVVARVARAMVQAVDLADPEDPTTIAGTVDLTVRMMDNDEWPLSVAAGQHATAAELASLVL